MSPTGRALGHFGLAVLVALMALPLLAVTALVPPWIEVHCQRRQILYWSERTKLHATSFAGFDFLFSGQKWSSTKVPPNPPSDTYFDSKEFSVHRGLLATEWGAIVVAAAIAYYKLARRAFQPPGNARSPQTGKSIPPIPNVVAQDGDGSSSSTM